MKDLLILLNSDRVRAVSCNEETCSTVDEALPEGLVENSQIPDVEGLASYLIDVTSDILSKKKKPAGIYFLVPPEFAHMSFLVVDKSNDTHEDQLVLLAEERLGASLENYYFQFNKIAPFTYQFVATPRTFLEGLLDVASAWSVPVKGVISWAMLLPKTLNACDPAIFITEEEKKIYAVFSDLNGVCFADGFEKKKGKSDIPKLIASLSEVRGEDPVDNVYTTSNSFTIGEELYPTHPLLKETFYEFGQGFELHSIFLNALEVCPEALDSSADLLNLLSVPEVRRVNLPVAAIASTLLLISVFLGGYMIISSGISSPESLIDIASQDVLGGVIDNVPTDIDQSQNHNSGTTEIPTELSKEDLVIRIENASGVNGAAGRTQALLEEQGYAVETIGTANNTIEITQFLFAKEVQDLKDPLKEALSDVTENPVVDVLADGDGASAEELSHNLLIIIGRDSNI